MHTPKPSTAPRGAHPYLPDAPKRHQSAEIASNVGMARGSSIGAECRVGPCTWIGRGASIGAGTSIGTDVHIGDGAIVGRGVLVRSYVRIGAGAAVGNGATVLGDVPADGSVPAGSTWGAPTGAPYVERF